MRYLTVLAPETWFQLGADVVILNPLHADSCLQWVEHQAAYEDGDGCFRLEGYAVLTRPRAAHHVLMRLGRGRWTAHEVAAVVNGANLYLRRALGLAWYGGSPIPPTPWIATSAVRTLPSRPPRQPPVTTPRTRRG